MRPFPDHAGAVGRKSPPSRPHPSRGTLEVQRGLLRHTLYLEELTHQLAADWTTYRHLRWPASANPHLLVSQKTAVDPDHPAVNIGTLRAALPKGLTLASLRQDRILNGRSRVQIPSS
ncbi:hypothetical protein OHB30_48485 [Streptomyces europaeiscabiei]|nr:hypothetical protein OHB30_48485 [Streptomyces europaeiscabiei]